MAIVNTAGAYEWHWRLALSVDHTKIPSTIPNATIKLTHACLPSDVFSRAKVDGSDIRFTSDAAGTTELAFEIVVFTNTPSLIAEIYVLVPNVSSSVDTAFYMWYGNPNASAYAVNATYGRNAVWTTASYISVHHFQESSGTLVNATGDTAYNGTSSNLTYGQDRGDGTKCVLFVAANNSHIALGGNSLNSGNNRTVQGWIKLAGWGGADSARILSNESGGNGNGVRVYKSISGHLNGFGGFGTSSYAGDNILTTDSTTWAHIAYTRSSANPAIVNLYINGVLTGTANQSMTVDNGGNCAFGDRGDLTNDRNFDGWMDEMRVSNAVQSADALLAAYRNESNPSTFIIQGATTFFNNWFLLADKNRLYNTMRGIDR